MPEVEFNERVGSIYRKYHNDIDKRYSKYKMIHFIAFIKAEIVVSTISIYKMLVLC